LLKTINSLIGNTSTIMLGKNPRATGVALEIFFLSIGWILSVGKFQFGSGGFILVRLPLPRSFQFYDMLDAEEVQYQVCALMWTQDPPQGKVS
jgi:hypothetical protein